ncbi:VOC family protein [Lentibacter algarum]|uniref:VOC family protein n=1 Tax=Lentibacter algarum TaxID=576131 RepID=UPI001C06554E|nr:VOC family protein [Lentibacter algarum]MBU2981109.1 VOC family protein [Lentibacter algarum]
MRRLSAVTYVVPSYDEGIAFFTEQLGFTLIEDTPLTETKRWVLVAAEPTSETRFLLAKADNQEQTKAIGNQTGGRVGFFLHTDDFAAEHTRMLAAGVTFNEEPRYEPYGTVAVFQDPWGNTWDLIEFAN